MPATAGARSTLVLFVTAVVLAATSAPACHAAHNITAILSGRRDLAEFSRELAATGLADDINGRNTITVLAVDDAHMAPLKARGLSRETLRHVLSLHVLVDFYDDAKLHRLPGGSADVSTLFQASGDAPGSAGMVKIAERRGGRVAFVPQDDGDDDAGSSAVFYVRSVHETPYNISVLQVSGVISSTAAEAPAAAAGPSRRNVSDVMSKNGCGRFADLVAATGDAAATLEEKANHGGGGGGITIFCPADKAVEAFQPTFDRLSADARLAVVLYHGAAGHYSMQALKAGDQDLRTMATLDGGKTDLGLAVRNVRDKLTLESATHNVARVTRTLADEEDVAVYMIDAVLVPAQGAGGTEHGELSSGSDGRSGGEDGGEGGHRTSGSSRASAPTPCCLPREWLATLALLFTLLAAFASG